jgi:hexosaminidase
VLTPEEAKHILGTQAQLWTEYIRDPKEMEYMAYPRMSALAEAMWTAKDRRDFPEFMERLRPHLLRLDALDVKYRKLDPPKVTQ